MSDHERVNPDANCGTRCDSCDERMCAHFGPEPRACGVTCVDCFCCCTPCWDKEIDRKADALATWEAER